MKACGEEKVRWIAMGGGWSVWLGKCGMMGNPSPFDWNRTVERKGMPLRR